ncbi:agmatinase [Planctomycetales bacterium]|nr:agmatinase [Planctomycetales bacterium]
MESSFLTLQPERSEPATAKYLIVPVPYEGSVCFLGGTSKGPGAILAVSNQMEHFDEELQIDFTEAGIATLPAVEPKDLPHPQAIQYISEEVRNRKIFQSGKIPIFLGGEHSITPPFVRAAAEIYDNISVLQFDAHADLRDSYTTGGKFSHGSAMRRVLEITPHLVQAGIRSFSLEEKRDCPEYIEKIITPQKIRSDFDGCIKNILYNLTEKVYITIDIDGLDPAFAPGTGTPEPGGLDWFQLTGILRQVCEAKTIIGADIVEVAPMGENNVITEFLAARLAGKLIAYTIKR